MARTDPTTEATLKASRALLGVVARSLADTLDDATLPQFRAMVVLSTSGPQRSGDLAERLGVHPSTFTRTADRLVANGWVNRVGNPDSRREVLIELTLAGRDVVDAVTERRRVEIHEILGRLSPAKRRVVLAGMTAFAEAAGEPSVSELLSMGA